MNERKKLYDDTLHFRKTDRVMKIANFWTYKIFDAGYKMGEALHDYDLMEKIQRTFHEKYRFDLYLDMGLRNPSRVTDALGSSYHEIDDENDVMTIVDHTLMNPDEYELLINDFSKFMWERIFCRRTEGKVTKEQFRNTAKEWIEWGKFGQRILKMFTEELLPVIRYSSLSRRKWPD